ncbi:MAG: iron-sulfur binding hydrogenase [Spirochaetaceae bacterium]|nr:iron-sulfur binding hydrogenase [Spirochaetaceae bacterium]
MKLKSITQILGYEELVENRECEKFSKGYTSDLLSDVIGNCEADSVLITIQAHKNTIAVATLSDIRGIILCNGRKAPVDMIQAAEDESIAIYQTDDNQFEASWKIRQLMDS